jgi:hypothetical protein
MAGLSLADPVTTSYGRYADNQHAALSNRSYAALPGAYGAVMPSSDNGYGYRKELKSGQERSSVPRARHIFAWPHEAFDTVLGQRSYSYPQLTAPALAAGCIAMLFPTPEFKQVPEPIQVYLEHLSVLFHSLAFSDNLPAVLDYHASVLRLMESGSLGWSRHHAGLLDGLRVNFLALLRSSQPPPATTTNKNPRTEERRTEANKICCRDFGAGKCLKTADHDGVKHICFPCYVHRATEARDHGTSTCPNKKRS